MKIFLKPLLALFVSIGSFPLAQNYPIETGQSNLAGHSFATPERTLHGISQRKAVAIANKDARTRYGSLSDFRVVPCEQVRFWRIMYDGGGPEYVIDKLSGMIIRRQTIPQGSGSITTGRQITKEEAIQIAKADAERRYASKGEDVTRFSVFACELSRGWRVIFDLRIESGKSARSFPNAGFPKYLIDKSTGGIIYHELN